MQGEREKELSHELLNRPSHKTAAQVYVELYIIPAHTALASILGLEYSTIETEMTKIERYMLDQAAQMHSELQVVLP
jgi:hypothetical protein